MKVSIKYFDLPMDVKNNGIEFRVHKGRKHLGDFYVTKAGVTWCKGRTKRANGIRLKWNDFIARIGSAAKRTKKKRRLRGKRK